MVGRSIVVVACRLSCPAYYDTTTDSLPIFTQSHCRGWKACCSLSLFPFLSLSLSAMAERNACVVAALPNQHQQPKEAEELKKKKKAFYKKTHAEKGGKRERERKI